MRTQVLVDLLPYNVGPADLRSAMFQALATGFLEEKTMSTNDGSGIVPADVPNLRVTYQVTEGEPTPMP